LIYLVNMPFSPIGYTPLGIPLISSILKAGGLPVKVFYLNFEFAKRIGVGDYEAIARGKAIESWLMEWMFSGELWDKGEGADDELFRISAAEGMDKEKEAGLRKLRRETVPKFLDESVKALGFTPGVKIVGFSCLFQVMPSLALGRRIKEAHPEIKLIYGGSGFHGVTGEELFDKIEWIDAVSNSEADDVALEAFRRLLDGKPLDGLQGMLYRDGRGRVYKTAGKPVSPEDFDNTPVPDFDDYIKGLSDNGWDDESKGFLIVLPFESSRGCWWFDRSPCNFCGLNGVSSVYRSKDPDRVLSALKSYRQRYGVRYFGATDNNLSMDYFKTFLPKLRRLQGDVAGAGGSACPYSIFYCVRPNLTGEQVKELAESGVILAQPGIESLSDNLLKQMNKGVSAIQNISFLKNARQHGVFALWYILMRMHGETQKDYDEMESLVPLLSHFSPPGGRRSFINCHRYSTYHRESDRYFEEIRPSRHYTLIYGDSFDTDKIAYLFDVKWRTSGEDIKYEPLIERLRWWRDMWRSKTAPALYIKDTEGGASLFDSRLGNEVRVDLDECENAVYGALDDISDKKSVLKRVAGFCDERRAEEILDSFVGYGFAVRRGESYLGLAHREGFKTWTQIERARLM
jgi:ribosomal peptide maturation radical SAM protein 1